jgi:ATP synthase protein I
MTGKPEDKEQDKMRRAVRLRQQRREHWRKEGERPLWRNLSMIGALGWLVVTPTLLGVLAGRWLDGLFDSGIFFSGALIFLGIVVGCYLAWQRVDKE